MTAIDDPTTIAIQSHLANLGIDGSGSNHCNLSVAQLYEEAILRQEGLVAESGPLVVDTTPHTGRSPQDRFIVEEPSSARLIDWGEINQPFPATDYHALKARVVDYLRDRDLFVLDCCAGADPNYRLNVRVITERAWHKLFARQLFIPASDEDAQRSDPEFTVIHAPGFKATPAIDGTRSDVFVIISFEDRTVLIGGTEYAGEIKKSIFSVMNYLLPLRQVMAMHCSANSDRFGNSAIFFGLSGTGKTTLSTDPDRTLIGDDEHGWTDDGIFNFEGGCYAKVIGLSQQSEPHIYSASHRYGTVLENVVTNPATGELDFDDESLTENTRAAYPISYIPNASDSGLGQHPQTIIMLTADAFGVMPPIAKLTPEQALYHFLSGYTAKVAGTEQGVSDPTTTFSACFGAPFLPLSPVTYADLLGRRIRQHRPSCWLINTGWTGGPVGVGYRMPLESTRMMVNAALNGDLATTETRKDPWFGFEVPVSVPGVPAELLDPRATWSDPEGYDLQARQLTKLFAANFQQFETQVPPEITKAGPHGLA